LDQLILSGHITFLFSDELLEEFISVALRPKFSRFFSKRDIEDLIDFFLESGSMIKIHSDIKQG
jgi:predicted nucleic acid-binding protein